MKQGASEAHKRNFKQTLREYGLTRPYFVVTAACFLFGIVVYVVSRLSTPFAEFWARIPSQGIRALLSTVSGLLPFSVVEWVIFSLPVLLPGYLVFTSRSLARNDTRENFFRHLLPIICAILIVLTVFLAAFGPCYFRSPLEDNLGLEKKDVSAEELYATAAIVCEQIRKLEDDVTSIYGGETVMPYDYNELVSKINDAYKKYAKEEAYVSHFPSRAKTLACSPVFTYTHISGVYTFMTGEVNINVNYPDFIRPFTIAHEFSHQRGIAKEEEANFVAYLVCIGSDDAYIQYAGYANMLKYLMDALAKADRTLYSRLRAEIPAIADGEFSAYSRFFTPYRENAASTVTNAVNNTFLSSQGEKKGTESYGLVVDLAVAYYASERS